MFGEPDVIHDASPAQVICRRYGTHLRVIRGVLANVKNNQPNGIFTQDDVDLITILCADAETRAEKAYREARQHEAETSGRTSEESRQYSGK